MKISELREFCVGSIVSLKCGKGEWPTGAFQEKALRSARLNKGGASNATGRGVRGKGTGTSFGRVAHAKHNPDANGNSIFLKSGIKLIIALLYPANSLYLRA